MSRRTGQPRGLLIYLTLATLLTLGASGFSGGSAASQFAPTLLTPTVGPTPAATFRLGSQPFVTLFCQFPNLHENIGLPAYYEGLLGGDVPGLADYWAEVSYGKIDLGGSRVTRWYLMPRPSNAYQLHPLSQATLIQLAEECTAAADAEVFFPAYAGINLVFNACSETAHGGLVPLLRDGVAKSYGVTWLCLGTFSWQSYVAHEMGHALGLDHSSDDSGEIYSSPWDIMSSSSDCQKHRQYGRIPQHPIAYHKDQLGWIPPARRYVAAWDSRAHIKLEQLAQPPTTGYLLAVIPLPGEGGHFYTVEARRRVGYDQNLPLDAIVIHRVDPDNSPAVILIRHESGADALADGAWLPGLVFSDPQHGVTVAVGAATVTGYSITISTGLAR